MRPEFREIIRILLTRKSILAATISIALIESLLAIALPYLSRVQIEVLESRIPAPGAALSTPLALFVALLAAISLIRLLQAAAAGLGRVIDVYARERFTLQADALLYGKMETMDAGFFNNPKNRRLLYVLFDVGQLPGAVLQFCKSQGRVAVALAGIFPILAVVDARILAVIAAAGALQLLVLRFRIRAENSYRLYKERRLADILEMKFLLRYHYHQVLGVSGEDRIMPRYWSRAGELVALETGQERLAFRYQLVNVFVEQGALAASAAVAGAMALSGALSIGAFTMVTMYVVYLQSCFGDINQSINEFYRLRSVFLQLGFFLALRPRVAVPDGAPAKAAIAGDIEVRDVSFRYPVLTTEECDYLSHLVTRLNLANKRREVYGSDLSIVREWQRLLDENHAPNPLVLDGVSCRFANGSITALVGRNGSGKTTLMNLLMRAYDPERGAIAIGGVPLATAHPAAARHAISMVAQAPFLLESYSLRDNLLLGAAREYDDAALWDILGELGLADELRRFPGGLDSVVGDEVNLSGGQAQLLCIARVMAQRRRVIILDEGTNQLDAENELRIVGILERLKRDAAVIIITHRMTTARKADLIHVMDGGRIVESGTHVELASRDGGVYRGFWEIQVVR